MKVEAAGVDVAGCLIDDGSWSRCDLYSTKRLSGRL